MIFPPYQDATSHRAPSARLFRWLHKTRRPERRAALPGRLLFAALTITVLWASAPVASVRAATLLTLSEGATEYTLKAQFVERFTRYVKWPDTALPEKTAPPRIIRIEPVADSMAYSSLRSDC